LVTDDLGIEYPSVEHAYQASKTMNRLKRIEISLLLTPGKAKRYGQTFQIREDWNQVKLNIMENLVEKKFQDEKLAELLKSTFPNDLIEGNNWSDKYWGCVKKNGVWIGQNNLGKILTNIRSRLLADDAEKGIWDHWGVD
jgi:ribA/ribD-fused uncharacterized protein